MDIFSQLTSTQLAQLDIYYNMLIEANSKFNLTAITDRDEVYTKHFIDSMLGHCTIPSGATVVDIGSGAGFPALPLKIFRPDIQVTLVDSLTKRVGFTTDVATAIGIEATCIHDRAEDFAKTHRESYDVATARAVAPLNILLEYTAPLVRVGGIVLAYKATDSELEQSANAIAKLGLQYNRTIQLQLPNGDPRVLIVLDKVSPTARQYPRGGNKPRKMPL